MLKMECASHQFLAMLPFMHNQHAAWCGLSITQWEIMRAHMSLYVPVQSVKVPSISGQQVCLQCCLKYWEPVPKLIALNVHAHMHARTHTNTHARMHARTDAHM